MKLKTTAFFIAASAGFAASASALTIDIVGSTAGRSAVYGRILGLITKTSSAASGSTLAGSNQAIIHGSYGATPVIIRLNFTGSAAGVDQVVNQVQVNFFKETFGTSGDTVSQSFSSPNIEASAPELGYSDVFQSTTAFKTPALGAKEDEVAIIPFKFFRHSDGNTSLTNVTNQAARYLYGSGGSAPLSLFTGLAADSAKTVYGTGRDGSSGTRITTFAEINSSQTAVSQYQPTVASDVVTALGGTSSGGFSSGSFVRDVVNAAFGDGTAGNPQTIIGYLGASDWPTQIAGNAVELKYNGVAYSTANLFNGSYTFWGFLHQFQTNLSGTSLTFYNALRDALVLNPGSGVEKISDMKVLREGDGFPINPILE